MKQFSKNSEGGFVVTKILWSKFHFGLNLNSYRPYEYILLLSMLKESLKDVWHVFVLYNWDLVYPWQCLFFALLFFFFPFFFNSELRRKEKGKDKSTQMHFKWINLTFPTELILRMLIWYLGTGVARIFVWLDIFLPEPNVAEPQMKQSCFTHIWNKGFHFTLLPINFVLI